MGFKQALFNFVRPMPQRTEKLLLCSTWLGSAFYRAIFCSELSVGLKGNVLFSGQLFMNSNREVNMNLVRFGRWLWHKSC